MQKAALGTILFAVAGLLIGLYGTGDRTMPDWLFWLSRTVLVGTLVVGLLYAAYLWAIVPAWRFHKSRRYQWPAVNKAGPPLYKKLIDMEDADRTDILKCLRISKQEVVFVDMENVKPLLRFYVTIWNSSVFTILIGPVTGQTSIGGKVLLQMVEDENRNWRSVQRKQPYRFELAQYVEPERLQEVRAAIGAGEITVSFVKLGYKIKIDEPGSDEIGAAFGWLEPMTFTVMGE